MISQTEVPVDALLGPYGLLAFLLGVVVFGGIKRWWVFGWTYNDKTREAQEWKTMALKGLGTTEKATDALQVATEQHPSSEQLILLLEEARRRGLMKDD